MAVLIRPGETRDAAPAIEVLRRSIRDLCVQDHGDDPQMVARWLANKTETAWASWIARAMPGCWWPRGMPAGTAGQLCSVWAW